MAFSFESKKSLCHQLQNLPASYHSYIFKIIYSLNDDIQKKSNYINNEECYIIFNDLSQETYLTLNNYLINLHNNPELLNKLDLLNNNNNNLFNNSIS